MRTGAWFRRGVRRRGRWRKRVTGARQAERLATFASRRWARTERAVDLQRDGEAPFRDVHGRRVWYPLEEYPIGCDIESTVRGAGGRSVTTLTRAERVSRKQQGLRADTAICLRHTDPYRRRIWCRTEAQARIEMERHGVESADGPGS